MMKSLRRSKESQMSRCILFFFVFLSACLSVRSQNIAARPEGAEAKKPAVDRAQFESLYRSAKRIQSAAQIGVNYLKMSELVQSFATEASIAKDKASTEEEKELVDLYASALKAYADSRTLWKNKVKYSDKLWKGLIVYSGENRDRNGKVTNSMVNRELTPIVQRYNLELADQYASITNLYWKSISPSAIQKIWKEADLILQKANKLYSGDAQ
jgi:hypothetical protein